MNKKNLVILIVVLALIIVGMWQLSKNFVKAPAQKEQVGVGASEYVVNISNFAFQPAEITINKGESVMWANNDSVSHLIRGGDFSSETLKTGDSFKYKFDNVGIYDYICGIHTYMKGKVIIK